MITIDLDFETRSPVDITSAGHWAYARHPDTQILMMSYSVNDEPVRLWLPGEPLPIEFFYEDAVFYAHNAEFELAISWNCEPFKSQLPLPIERLYCTAAMAAAAGLPRSLDGASKALRLEVLKQEGGKRLIKLFCIPPYAEPAEHPHDWDLFKSYCIDDTRVGQLLRRALPPLSEFERRVFVEHLRINARGVRADVGTAAKLHALCREAERRLVDFEGGELLSRPTLLVAALSFYGIEVPNAQARTLEDLDLDDEDEGAVELVTKRLQFAKASTKKLIRIAKSAMGDNRLRGMHVFYGAHTGRWSGALYQPQNLVRGTLAKHHIQDGIDLINELSIDDLIDILGGPGPTLKFASLCTRPMLMAEPGNELFVSDFAAIEAKLVVWFANAAKVKRIYEIGEDPYRHAAMGIYHLAYEAIGKSSHERFVGKQTILGSGYGMGWVKFVLQAWRNGVRVPPEEAQAAIKLYREDLAPEVPALWKEIDSVVIRVLDPTMRGIAVPCADGKLLFWATFSGERPINLHCRLPDGEVMSWLFPQVVIVPSAYEGRPDDVMITCATHKKDATSARSVITARAKKADIHPSPYLAKLQPVPEGWVRIPMWGGKFLENIVQKSARNLLALAMLRCADARLGWVLHVHDEGVAEGPPERFDEFHRIMDYEPEAYRGALMGPVKVESWHGPRYRKG